MAQEQKAATPQVRNAQRASQHGPERDAEREVASQARNAPRTPQHAAEHEPEHEPEHAPAKRTRRRMSTVNDDTFHIPMEEIPEGSSYEFKRFSVNGQEDPFYIARMREQGWEPVDPKRHPNWLPPGYSLPHIIKGGQILMERPMELTKEARAENRVLARQQVREAEQRLGMTPKDTLTRDHEGIKPRVVKEYMRPMSIEE
jgi:hypothetical protein